MQSVVARDLGLVEADEPLDSDSIDPILVNSGKDAKYMPVQVAEYAVANKISSKPTFAWWVPFTLRKRDCIIKAVTARLKKKNQ